MKLARESQGYSSLLALSCPCHLYSHDEEPTSHPRRRPASYTFNGAWRRYYCMTRVASRLHSSDMVIFITVPGLVLILESVHGSVSLSITTGESPTCPAIGVD